MRFIISLVAVLTAIGVGAFAFLSAGRTIPVPAHAIASLQIAPESQSVAAPLRHTPVSQLAQVSAAETPGAPGVPTRVEQESQTAASAPNASAQNMPAPAASTIPQCDKPGGMGPRADRRDRHHRRPRFRLPAFQAIRLPPRQGSRFDLRRRSLAQYAGCAQGADRRMSESHLL